MKSLTLVVSAMCIVATAGYVNGAVVVSDGSDGAFHPTSSQTINLESVAPDGVFNFTTIDIPAGVTIRFVNNILNTPVFFAATGDMSIRGVINISGSNYSRSHGPGGSLGGLGSPNYIGSDGDGPAGGQGGPAPVGQGNAGGGGGMATPGLMATSLTGGNPGLGGNATSFFEFVPGQSGSGGSGGGGGGGRMFHTTNMSGGDGGGSGGALQLATGGNVTIEGSIITNGGHGSWAFANVFAHGGPGGGGSGGNIEIHADTLTLTETAVIQAHGGAGGGLSTQPVANDPWTFTCGAHGGSGYVLIDCNTYLPHASAFVGAVIVPDLIPGDANGDGTVDLQDFGLFKANFGTTGGATRAMGDFNGDGNVDLQDFGLLKANFGTGGTGEGIPEPATLSLLIAGGALSLRRKRRRDQSTVRTGDAAI